MPNIVVLLPEPVGPVTGRMPADERISGCSRAVMVAGASPSASTDSGALRGVEDPDDRVLAVVAGNDRDPEVHRHDAGATVHAGAEAPVLRPPALGDVQAAQDLDP